MKRIITIGRQCASGGSEIGQKLSDLTGIPCYDREALVKIGEKHGIPRETFEKADEQATSSFLYSLAMSSYNGSIAHYGANEMVLTDKVFSIQSSEIKKIAEEDECIIIGRCADDVLSSFECVTKVFIHAPLEWRIARLISERQDLNEMSARKFITKADKRKASYYNFYTEKSWGDAKEYNLCIDSSILGIEGTANLLLEFIKLRYNN